MAYNKYLKNVEQEAKELEEVKKAKAETETFIQGIKDKHPGRRPKRIQKLIIAKKESLDLVREKAKMDLKTKRSAIFLDEYLKNGGNATEAVKVVFGVKNPYSARVLGSRMLKETKEVGRAFMEQKDLTYGKMLDVAKWKMFESKDTDWWDRLMKIGGYEDFLTKNNVPSVVNIVGTQDALQKQFGFTDGEVVDKKEDG